MASPPPPPPPPPHGEAPKTTAGGAGLPTGKYDIFVIPEHSAGGGFLYLPSLRPNTNSFIAGFASALLMVVLGQSMAPAFQAWWANFQGMGNAGMMLLVIAVGLGAWSLGRQQSSEIPGAGAGAGAGANGGFYSGGGTMPGGSSGGGGFSSAGSTPRSAHAGPTPNGGTHSQAPPGGSQPSANKPNGSYQRPPQPPEPEPQPYARPPPEPKPEPTPQPPPPPPPQPTAAKPKAEKTEKAETLKNAWQKAKEEVRRNEEERKAKEAAEKIKAEVNARKKELRERDAKERAARDAERQRRETEAQAKKEKEIKEARAKETLERLVREREERRKKLDEEKKEKLRKEQEVNESRKSSSYAYSGVGEKTNPWPAGKPPTASPQAGKPDPRSPSPMKPPAPTARSFTGTEDEAYSYRPYDQPKRPAGRRPSNSDMSESSWAPSQSTARTTPPPSVRGPYSTKDPDKIVIKAVYCFMNQFAKTPASQLLSGVGSVTDGLILRITTEGMFIDDDVRGVAQREWDVKAWTLKNVEVWCPVHFLASAIAANSPPSPTSATPPASANSLSTAFFAKTTGGIAKLRAADRGVPKTLSGADADTYLTKVLDCCKDSCRFGQCASKFADCNIDDSLRTNSPTTQTGDWKAKGLHLLRATIRDMDGKRYMFVIGEEEGWKVIAGLQRLRKGTQVRSLGVAGLSGLDTKNTLEMLGWGG